MNITKHKISLMIKLYYDTETTGTNFRKHSIHELGFVVEVDNEIVEEHVIHMKPHPKAIIEPEAMKVCKRTIEEIMQYPEMKLGHMKLLGILGEYVDQYNPKEKIVLVGFNNRYFDDPFLRKFFELCGDMYYGSWFRADSLDAMVLASEYLLDRRAGMTNFKMGTVATELGIVFNEDELHGALADAKLTRQIYRIVTNREMEI